MSNHDKLTSDQIGDDVILDVYGEKDGRIYVLYFIYFFSCSLFCLANYACNPLFGRDMWVCHVYNKEAGTSVWHMSPALIWFYVNFFVFLFFVCLIVYSFCLMLYFTPF